MNFLKNLFGKSESKVVSQYRQENTKLAGIAASLQVQVAQMKEQLEANEMHLDMSQRARDNAVNEIAILTDLLANEMEKSKATKSKKRAKSRSGRK